MRAPLVSGLTSMERGAMQRLRRAWASPRNGLLHASAASARSRACRHSPASIAGIVASPTTAVKTEGHVPDLAGKDHDDARELKSDVAPGEERDQRQHQSGKKTENGN